MIEERGDVRQDVPGDDRQAADPHVLGGPHELPLLDRQRHRPDHASCDHPAEGREQHHEHDPAVLLEAGRQDGDDQERRQHQQDVDDEHDDPVRSAAEVAGRSAEEPGHRRAEEGDQQPDQQRLLHASRGLGEDVLADVVGAEPVQRARRLPQRGVVELRVAPAADQGADECEEEQQDQHDDPERGSAVREDSAEEDPDSASSGPLQPTVVAERGEQGRLDLGDLCVR